MQVNNETAAQYVIDASELHYRELNREIQRLNSKGAKHIILKNVRGQRYIGDALTDPDLLIDIEGIPGEDLGFGMGGPTIVVHGHAQNAIGNTMDSGTVVVHGLAGDALAYGMRGGSLFVRDDVGYRVGIHMKAFREKVPLLVIGGTSGDFLGEYMAGGTLVLLNRTNRKELVCGDSDKTLATGIHGGEIFILGYEVPDYLLGIGARMDEPTEEQNERLHDYIEQFADRFQLGPELLFNRSILRISPLGSRPFAKFYFQAYPISCNLQPEKHERTSPCEAACPAGVPTGRFLRHLRQGEPEQALELLDEVTPFRYSCCGFICPHLCMQACTRCKVDFPVRTAELAKAYRIDTPPKKIGHFEGSVAVIGAGPAGLSAAYHLARLGYSVTVYDSADRPGGKMYQVISRTRLPIEDLEHDLTRIAALGVNFTLHTTVGEKLCARIISGHDYVIVAAGAQEGVIPPVAGREHIKPGIAFLKQHNTGKTIELGRNVIVIGCGDAAIDGIEAALLHGADPKHITVIDIQTPSGDPEEIQKLKNLGVIFRYPVMLQEVTEGAVHLKNESGSSETLAADTVLAFINERPDLSFLPKKARGALDERGFFINGPDEPLTFRTPHQKVSLVGDVNGLGLVTTNIGRGRECARETHALLQGLAYEPILKNPVNPADLHPERHSKAEESLPLGEEPLRCLHCGVCVQCDECVSACPRGALTREGDEFHIDLNLCGGCGTCAETCKGGVIRMVPRR